MELSAEEEKKLNYLMGYKISEKDNFSAKYLNLGFGPYIDANNSFIGYSGKWVKRGAFSFQELRQDFNKVVAEDHTSINAENCRKCKEVITPYKKIYFRRINEGNGSFWFKAYGFNNNFCEACAQALSDKEIKATKAPRLLRDYNEHLAGDKSPTRVMEFEGFTLRSNDRYKKLKK